MLAGTGSIFILRPPLLPLSRPVIVSTGDEEEDGM